MRQRRFVPLTFLAAALVVCSLTPPAAAASPAVVRDSCLTGQWRISGADATALLNQLVGLQNATYEGTIYSSFRRGTMKYGSTLFEITQQLGDATLKSSATWLTEAPYRTRNGKLILGAGQSELDISEFTAQKGGQTITVPGPPTRTTSVAPGALPYRCTSRTLSWPVPAGVAGSTMVTFRRA